LFILISGCVARESEHSETTAKAPEYHDYLLYISSRGEGFDIYRYDSLGVEKRLTSNPGWDWFPQPLNDGSFVYYSTDTLDQFSIRRMNLAGDELLFDSFGKEDIAVSPDGKSFVYYHSFQGTQYMGLLSTSTPEDSTSITPKGIYSGRAHWSPDGKKIAYISDRTGTNQLFMYNVGTGKSMQLTEGTGTKKYISWSPSGEQIAFTSQEAEGPADIYIFSLDYGTIDQVTKTPVNESEISWSPNGKYIAYHAGIDGEDHIYSFSLRDSSVQKLTDFGGYHGEPRWIRDK
jgi:TolB protein